MANKLFLFAAAVVALPGICHADSILGVAGAYNLVALNGNITTGAEVNGRIAASNEILGGTTIGTAFQTHQADPNGFAGAYVIVAGNDAGSSATFNVNGGGNVYANGANPANFHLANEGGGTVVTSGPSPIDFAGLRSSLDTESLNLAALAATTGETLGRGSSPINPQFFVLKGTNALINVFNISAADFYNNGAALDIEVPPGSTVIINVDGAQIDLATGIYLNGSQESDQNNDGGAILFNFSDATTVQIAGQLDGSILAPLAAFSNTSQLGGTVIASSIDESGEIHNIEFTGTVPPTDPTVPEPATLAMVGTGLLSLASKLRRKAN
jgi:choice-of-anchor A domain-containing protein